MYPIHPNNIAYLYKYGSADQWHKRTLLNGYPKTYDIHHIEREQQITIKGVPTIVKGYFKVAADSLFETNDEVSIQNDTFKFTVLQVIKSYGLSGVTHKVVYYG